MTDFTQEIKRLQKLSCISLSPEEEQKLGAQLIDIIGFLGKLPELKDKNIGGTSSGFEKGGKKENSLTLRTVSGVCQESIDKKILKNVKHTIINNSIVIKSVLN